MLFRILTRTFRAFQLHSFPASLCDFRPARCMKSEYSNHKTSENDITKKHRNLDTGIY